MKHTGERKAQRIHGPTKDKESHGTSPRTTKERIPARTSTRKEQERQKPLPRNTQPRSRTLHSILRFTPEDWNNYTWWSTDWRNSSFYTYHEDGPKAHIANSTEEVDASRSRVTENSLTYDMVGHPEPGPSLPTQGSPLPKSTIQG